MPFRLSILFAYIPLSFVFVGTADPNSASSLGREDGLIESAGALGFAFASFVFLYCYIKSDGNSNIFLGRRSRRNIYLLLLCILFFVGFGEEISWGQRIFGWNTPSVWEEINAQNETNIHNLWLFQSYNPDGTAKSFSELLLNANRLMSIFWLSFCVIIPILFSSSSRIRNMISWLGVPVPSMKIGWIFIVNFVSFQFMYRVSPVDGAILRALNELKETNYSLLFFILSLSFLMTKRKDLVAATAKSGSTTRRGIRHAPPRLHLSRRTDGGRGPG